jgi:hypothetical protein
MAPTVGLEPTTRRLTGALGDLGSSETLENKGDRQPGSPRIARGEMAHTQFVPGVGEPKTARDALRLGLMLAVDAADFASAKVVLEALKALGVSIEK